MLVVPILAGGLINPGILIVNTKLVGVMEPAKMPCVEKETLLVYDPATQVWLEVAIRALAVIVPDARLASAVYRF